MMLPVHFIRRRYGAFRADVDPKRIRYVKDGSEWPGYVRRWPFLLCPGNWDVSDREYAPFREDLMRQLFVERRHYAETDVYKWLVGLLERGERTADFPCGSRAEINGYFERVQRLGASIEADGVLPPAADPDGPRDGITVRVARDGSLLKCKEGTHRLAIARALDVPRVPVIVDLVHTRWARKVLRRTSGWSEPAEVHEAIRRSLEEAGIHDGRFDS